MKHKYINMSNSQTLETFPTPDPLMSSLAEFMNTCEQHPDWENMHVPFKQEQQNASPETPDTQVKPDTQVTLDTRDDWCDWEPKLCVSGWGDQLWPSDVQLAEYAKRA